MNGVTPLQEPLPALRVCPSCAVPEIAGSAVFAGAFPTTTAVAGDVAFAEASEVAGHITPVPGGVGAMTIICLMRNTMIAATMQNGLALPNL